MVRPHMNHNGACAVSQYMYYGGGAEMCVFMFHNTCIMVVELKCVFSCFTIHVLWWWS